MPPDGEPIVVTGLGLVLPQGVGLEAAQAVFDGRSAIDYLPAIPGMPGATGAALGRFTLPAGTETYDRAIQFAVAAAEEAWTMASAAARPPGPERVATVISLSKGATLSMMRWAGAHGRQGESADAMESTADAAARIVADRLEVTGPISAPITACVSGGHALAWGATLIRRGLVDAALVGASEASLHPMVIGSYRRMGVLAAGGDDPAASVRPFSATRRGFAIGEGAAVLVLESAASARAHHVCPLARLLGWATGCQTASLTGLEEDGATLAQVVRLALARAGVCAEAVDMVHAHGTATAANDLAEARALVAALGPAAGRASVTSTKGSHGHLLGAATAVELALTVLAIRCGLVPPTANLTDPDPAIGLDCTPLVARPRRIRHALKIASGFGGHVLAAVLAE